MIGMFVFAGILAAAGTAPVTIAPAPAQAAPALASNAAPAAAAPDRSKLICETDDETGSRLAKRRTCLTADQWREMRRQERLDVEHDQRIGRKGE